MWARAKHRVELERPHFCTRFRVQSDDWGRSSPRNSLRCFARWRRRILEETGKDEVDAGDAGKNCGLHFHHYQLLQSMLSLRNWFSSLCDYRLCESRRANKVKSALRANAYREAA